MKEHTSRSFYISVLNVMACIAVIFLHCNGVFWQHPQGRLWITANMIEAAFYWAVPIFFMNIGVTSLDYRNRYSTKEFLLRRFKKTGIPFVAWSFIGLFFNMLLQRNFRILSVKEIISGLVNTEWIAIYWFFIPLFVIYLSIPVISSIVKENRIKIFGYMIVVGTICNIVLPFLFSLLGITFNEALKFPVVSGFIIYVLIGYNIHHCNLNKRHFIIAIIAILFGFILQVAGTMYFTPQNGEINRLFKGYLNMPAFIMSVGVFVVGKFIGEKLKQKKLQKVIYFLSQYTFGIYLIHIFYVMVIPTICGINTSSILWRTIGVLFIFSISCLTCFIAKKIPFLKWLLP